MPVSRLFDANVCRSDTVHATINNYRFPPADVFWTTAMALDVYLIVFRRYDAEALRKLELKYFGVITTLVFIPAIAFLFVHTEEKGPMYGSVTVGNIAEFHDK